LESKNVQRKGRTLLGTSILEVYQKYISGLRAGSGNNYTGYCPIHGETPGKSSPSISINAETGQWYCFAGCGGGSLKSFLREVESPTKSEQILSSVHMPKKRRVADLDEEAYREVVLPEKILGVFDSCPTSLVDSGFSWRTLQQNDVGFDADLSRITFPVRNRNGELVGIVGRTLHVKFGGKYKVYTREFLKFGYNVKSFRKGNYLWREDKVHSIASHSEARPTIYVVEGFKAALWLVQAGLETTVALMGSSMSLEQKKKLERFGGRIVLCLDNDAAGRKATIKIAGQLKSSRVSVAVLPDEAQQPDYLSEGEILDVCFSPISVTQASIKWRKA